MHANVLMRFVLMRVLVSAVAMTTLFVSLLTHRFRLY